MVCSSSIGEQAAFSDRHNCSASASASASFWGGEDFGVALVACLLQPPRKIFSNTSALLMRAS